MNSCPVRRLKDSQGVHGLKESVVLGDKWSDDMLAASDTEDEDGELTLLI